MHPLLEPPYGSSAQVQDTLSGVADRAQAFVRSVPVTADDIELSMSLDDEWGYSFVDGQARPTVPQQRHLTRIRLFRGNRVGLSSVEGHTKEAWFRGIEQAEARLTESSEERPGAPAASFPDPVTFDAQLADFACDHTRIGELAEALLDNSVHEIDRVGRPMLPGGHLIYKSSGLVLARCLGVKSALTGHLEARIEFGNGFSERVIQVHGPESFLPLALMGARAFRNMPGNIGDARQLPLGSAMPLVIHPRVLEALLRTAGVRLFQPATTQLIPSGVKIASEHITLIDDPHLDGLMFSRSFDDAGLATRRLPLMVNGRVTQRFSSGAPMNPLRGEAGNRWHRGSMPGTVSTAFSSILLERGSNGFHELIGCHPQHVLINSLGPIEVDEDPTGHFCAPIQGAVIINGKGPNEILPPNRLRFEGRLFGAPGGGAGLLSHVQVSRELHDTGSAILPYLVTQWPLILND